MNDIVEGCKEWMSRKLTEANCFSFLQLAEKYNIDTVEDAITDFVFENFVTISETKGFTEISQQALCRYLSSDSLNTDIDEFIVFKAAKTWINKNKITDSKIIIEIMKNIRYALIPPSPLSKQVAIDDLIDDHKECRRLVSEAMEYHANVYTQPFSQGKLTKPRGKPNLLVISNGPKKGNSFNTVPCDEKLSFLSKPDFELIGQSDSLDHIQIVYESMSSVQIDNFLFLFACKCDGYQNFTMRYNASNDTWIELAAVPREATVGSRVAYSEYKREIFLIGGMPVHTGMRFQVDPTWVIPRVYSYNIQGNSWSSCIDLPEGLMYSGVATLDNNVFTTGGCSRDKTTHNVYAFDVKAKIWLTKASMNHKRQLHTLNALNGQLYAIGGSAISEDVENVLAVEVYESLCNQWTVIKEDGPTFFGKSSIVFDNKIYIICTDKIVIYEVDKNSFTSLPHGIPYKAFRNVSAMLTMPNLL